MNKLAEKKKSYFQKLKGTKVHSGLPRPKLSDAFLSGLGVSIVLSFLAFLTFEFKAAILFLPFSASAFIIFALPKAPVAQPRSVIGGHVLSALVGVALYVGLGQSFWVVGLAGGVVAALMVVTKAWHPPAVCTALIPVMTPIGNWLWVSYPVGLGSAIVVIIGLLYNNLLKDRTYPDFWW